MATVTLDGGQNCTFNPLLSFKTLQPPGLGVAAVLASLILAIRVAAPNLEAVVQALPPELALSLVIRVQISILKKSKNK